MMASIWDMIPNLTDLIALFVGLGLIAVMVWFGRSRPSSNGFVIHVTEEDISFTGNFPPGMQQEVIDFLRNDCQVAGDCQIRGYWEMDSGRPMLVVAVKGDGAKMMEQRIRNYLKLNVKPPRG